MALLCPPAVQQMVGDAEIPGYLRNRRAESRTNQTFSALKSSVNRHLVLVVMRSSDFITLLLIQVSVNSGESQR